MKHGRLADFFFVGLGIVPVALVFGGLPHVAFLIFIPLLFVACCFGMAEQIEDAEKPKDGSNAGKGASPRDAPRLTFRKAEGVSRKAEGVGTTPKSGQNPSASGK